MAVTISLNHLGDSPQGAVLNLPLHSQVKIAPIALRVIETRSRSCVMAGGAIEEIACTRGNAGTLG